MRFTPPEDEVELYKSGFEDDFLGRRDFGEKLSYLLDNIEDPLVVALDGPWGTGKTHFLKRWVGAHQVENGSNALTVYFDAFAHDYFSEPLIALVGALSDRLPKNDASIIDALKKTSYWLALPAVRVGLAVASSGASEVLTGVGAAAVEAAKTEAKEAADTFWKREENIRESMKEFRHIIEKLTKAEPSKRRPIIIVIDELDRCRPDFALELLEIVKHFFALPFVHFVLGGNMSALENSVKVRYGHDIDASKYLQKFVSIRVSLPDLDKVSGEKNAVSYSRKRLELMGIPRVLSEEITSQIGILGRVHGISLREVSKILLLAAILPGEAKNPKLEHGRVKILVTLLIMKVIRADLYDRLVNRSVSDEDLKEILGAKGVYVDEERYKREYNKEFNRYLKYLHEIWGYICDAGDADYDGHYLARSLSESGYIESKAEITKTADGWLNTFHIQGSPA